MLRKNKSYGIRGTQGIGFMWNYKSTLIVIHIDENNYLDESCKIYHLMNIILRIIVMIFQLLNLTIMCFKIFVERLDYHKQIKIEFRRTKCMNKCFHCAFCVFNSYIPIIIV